MAAPLSLRCFQFSTRIFQFNHVLTPSSRSICVSSYLSAVKKGGKAGKLPKGMKAAPPEKKFLDVEMDPVKLCTTLVGGNTLKGGSDPVIKEDSEYPDWLFEMKLDKGATPLEDMEPDTWRYWNRLKTLSMRRQKLLLKNMHKYKRF